MINQFNQPEHIPILSELFSKLLVISTENNLKHKISKTNIWSKVKPYFSPAHRMAFDTHEKVCRQWRVQGRPTDANHPAKIAKLQSQRNLQRIS